MNLSAVKSKIPIKLDRNLLLVAAICCFGIWTFVELADDAPEGDYLTIENKILLFFRSAENPEKPWGPVWLEETALEFTSLGSLPVLIYIIILCLTHLVLIRKFGVALLVFLSTLSGGFLTFFLKDFFRRDRPDSVSALVDVMTYSFPSGHAMTSSIVYMTLGALLAQAAVRPVEKFFYIAAALSLSFVIGLTRIYLGVHFPTDVMAGWAAGTAWALICWSIPLWFVKFKRTS